jgi:hypothetical protein
VLARVTHACARLLDGNAVDAQAGERYLDPLLRVLEPFSVNDVKINYLAHGSNASYACGPPLRVSSLPVARA